MIDVEKAWIETASGGQFHILEPRQDEILITDIGHALGMLCRFTGHCRRFYSVAEHSVHASRLVPEDDALWALMHDSSEAYISDVNSPMKHFTDVGVTYKRVEAKVMKAICKKFGLPVEQPQSVHEVDMAMLYAEKDQIMSALPWSDKGKSADVKIRCWSPDVAKSTFLTRFYELTGQI